MNDLKPLESSVGQPAEGKDKYFPREKITKKILRKLEVGENILISAPRRIGKSSVLKDISNNPQSGQIIKYMIVQSVDSSDEFFKKLFNELLNDQQIIKGIKGYLTRASNEVKKYSSRITGVSLNGSVDIGVNERIDYYYECTELIKNFEGNNKNILVIIDEYPDALNNIIKNDKKSATKFLQQNRDFRGLTSDVNLQFIYTGSTGLKNIVTKLDRLDLINDLNTIQISPLKKDEATLLIQRLTLGFQEDNKNFEITTEIIEYILQKTTWLIPYYIQIIVDELFEYYEEHEKTIDKGSVELIFREIVKSKSNHSDYFENWKKRLKTAFKKYDYSFAIECLNTIAKNNTIEYAVLHDLSIKNKVKDVRYILDVLEHDGYISENEKTYAFNSVFLKEWWYINVAT